MPLKTLEEYNDEVTAALTAMETTATGIACPIDAAELVYYTNSPVPVADLSTTFDRNVFCPNCEYKTVIKVLR